MKKILVIDDEKSIRTAFKILLSKEGYDVLTAEDYPSALAIISGEDLDLVITDIILEGHTGIDILRNIKDRGMLCPVIMITGEPNLETATDAIRLEAFDYLPKPVRKETLLRITKQALNHKALLDEKKHLETENERYRRNLEAIFGSMQDAVITVDGKMRVIEVNKASENICGILPHAIVGKDFSKIQTRCHKQCLDVLKEALDTKRAIREFRVECSHQDRPRQVVLLTSSPLMYRQEKFIGAVLVVRDITRLTALERELKERHQFHNIVGKSRKIQEIFKLLEDLADTDTTVLIAGESGTGKELVARAIHYESIRSAKPLVTVNCTALAENLLESELFGHVRGAFTGAFKDRLGRFQAADGGSIFLDEIGETSSLIQLKLLRVLQERVFERVGDSNPIAVDVRVIAVTNRNLKEKIRLGEFREDLYYRLKVVEIVLPPLRERREDIPLLVDHFCRLLESKFKKNINGISDDVLNTFMQYPWPGNIRELEHAIEHAFVICRDRTIDMHHLPPEIKSISEPQIHVPGKRPANDPEEILDALSRTDWNKAKAARMLGLSRPTLYQKIKKYHLTEPSDQV